MKKTIAYAAALIVGSYASFMAFAAPIAPAPSGFVQNSAAPQNAQINIGTATVRGTLTVSTVAVTNLAVTSLSVTQVAGSGSGLTGIDASQLSVGTVPAGRLTGAYPGVTGVGAIASGSWLGSVIGTQRGGTGQDFSSTPQGYLPYFAATGTMTALPPASAGWLLQTGGASANPAWTGAPSVLGTNITAIPMANLVQGSLPQTIA